MYLDDANGKNMPQSKEEEDAIILALSIHDPNAFGTIIDRYEEAFIRKAHSILKNREAAEDAVQETFTKIYIHASKFKEQDGASFKSWGYKILVNTCFTAYQKIKKDKENTREFDSDLESILGDQRGIIEEKQKYDKDYVLSLLARLPDAWGRIMKLHFVEGKSQEEIAEKEGISEGALRVRIHRAKEELKKISSKM